MAEPWTAERVDREHAIRLAAQKADRAAVADGLIGIAQGLEKIARRLKENARQVRRGEYLADFAYAHGRGTRYEINQLIDGELPEGMDS